MCINQNKQDEAKNRETERKAKKRFKSSSLAKRRKFRITSHLIFYFYQIHDFSSSLTLSVCAWDVLYLRVNHNSFSNWLTIAWYVHSFAQPAQTVSSPWCLTFFLQAQAHKKKTTAATDNWILWSFSIKLKPYLCVAVAVVVVCEFFLMLLRKNFTCRLCIHSWIEIVVKCENAHTTHAHTNIEMKWNHSTKWPQTKRNCSIKHSGVVT